MASNHIPYHNLTYLTHTCFIILKTRLEFGKLARSIQFNSMGIIITPVIQLTSFFELLQDSSLSKFV